MTSKHPAILIRDPVRFNYDDFFNIVLENLHKNNPSLSTIDILISQFIGTCEELNLVLSRVYNKLRKKTTELGWDYSFEIDVLFNQDNYSSLKEQLSKVIYLYDEKLAIPQELVVLEMQEIIAKLRENTPKSKDDACKKYQQYPVAAVGGTFDHLHDGHKILLSLTVFGTSKTVIVGITGPKLLIKKKYAKMLDSFEKRQSRVAAYLKKIMNYGIKFEIFQINDICGPTGYVQEIDLLVVSEESSSGGNFVNKTRKQKGYTELDIITVKVVGDENTNEKNNWKGKLSSTGIRKQEYLKKYNRI